MEYSAPKAIVAEFNDPAMVSLALRDVAIEYLTLAATGYAARLTSVDLGPVRLQDAFDDAHITRGTIDAERSLILFSMDALPDGTLLNGHAMQAQDAMVLGPGSGLHARVLGPHRWAGLTIDAQALRAAAGDDLAPKADSFAAQHCAPAVLTPIVALVAEVGALACTDPSRFAAPVVCRDIADAFIHHGARVLRAPGPDTTTLRALRRRVRLVRDAEELMEACIGSPQYSEDVCAVLDVSRRALHDAFLAVRGMSLHRFLRLRRLNLVREALRSHAGGPAQVKAAALDFGFWHFGRFAREYRALFGEMPSETLRHAQRD